MHCNHTAWLNIYELLMHVLSSVKHRWMGVNMRVNVSVCVGVSVLPVLAACRRPFVISSLCQWEFQASHWADWTEQSVCNSPSTICRSLNSPLLWSRTQNEGLLLLPFYLKAPPRTRCFSPLHGSVASEVEVHGKSWRGEPRCCSLLG